MGGLSDRIGQLDRFAQRLTTEALSVSRRSRRWHDRTERAQRERRTGASRVPGARIAVICVTSRSQHLEGIAHAFRSQTHPHRELVVVVNGHDVELSEVDSTLGEVATDIDVRRDASLGACLNVGIARSSAPFVAKWDDDDWYGPHYLADQIAAWEESRAAVVGKHSYFAHLARSDRMIVRFPGHEQRPTSFVAGGTLLLDRSQLADAPFPDVSIGEDGGLLRSAEAVAGGIYSGTRFGYVQRRDGNNTWTIDDERFARGSLDLGPGLQLDRAML